MPEVKVQLRQVGPTTSEATLPRGHSTLVDRPEAKGGTDRGPMGGEYFLTSIGGCLLSTLYAVIIARDAPVSNVRAEVTGTLVDGPARFERVSVRITGDCDDQKLFEHLVGIAESGCLMTQTLRQGVELTVSAGVPA